MKLKLLFAAFAFLFFAQNQLKAQEVFNAVVNSTSKILEDPTRDSTSTRIAQFKMTALVYLKNKAFETQKQVSTQFLNTQAYWLSEFVTLYLNEMIKMQDKSSRKKRDKLALFMNATLDNTLFGDLDVETTHAYINSGTDVTPFSLDTNWEKAFRQAKSGLK